MTAARRYHTRTPRYVLKTDDESLMRFAGMETRGVTLRARVRDLSETGLAFAIGTADAPQEGAVLKIEFTVPGRSQMACFASVVRVEIRQEWDADLGTREHALVACHFRNLPAPHAKALSHGLSGLTRNENQADMTDERRKRVWTFAGLSLSLVLAIMALATPAASWVRLVQNLFT